MKSILSTLAPIKEARKPYIILNIVYYGLIVCAMIYSAFNQPFQQFFSETVISGLPESPLGPVLEAYSARRGLLSIGLTFGTNLVLGSFIWITLPSLLVPFSGLLLAGIRAVMWGLLFYPQNLGEVGMKDTLAGILIAGVILLEGQGYVLAMLGATLQGIATLWPQRVGVNSRWQGFKFGMKEQARVYLWVAVVLLVAAVYEVWVAMMALPSLLG